MIVFIKNEHTDAPKKINCLCEEARFIGKILRSGCQGSDVVNENSY